VSVRIQKCFPRTLIHYRLDPQLALLVNCFLITFIKTDNCIRMKKGFLITMSLLAISSTLTGQKPAEIKFHFFCTVGLGRSSFDVSIPSSKFTTPEFRAGIGVSKPIRKFEIKLSVLPGIKGTRTSYLKGTVYSQPGIPLYSLNETVSSRSHLVIDFPLMIQYNTKNPKLGIRLGFNTRIWAPNNDHVDVLTARIEGGLVGGACIRFKHFSLGADGYYGLTEIYGGSIDYSGQYTIRYSVKNTYLQLTIEIPFKSKE
jgi:hypothetical protein